MMDKGNKAVSRARKPSLFARVVALIEEARQKVATVANLAQVCLILCHPIDGSPPGSPVPGILHIR